MEKNQQPIETEGKYLIALLRAAIRSEVPPSAPQNLNWKVLFSLAKSHAVEATVFRSVESGGQCPEDILCEWKKCADRALAKELMYDAERGEILAEFDKAGIKYLPLKGIIIKNFYPRRGMRQFTDNDILFDKKRKKKVREIMLARGYSMDKFASRHSEHDVYQKLPAFNFEMHRDLVDESALYKKYFDKIWERAVKDEGDNCAWHMTDDDFYVYNLAHFYYHYTHGGAGIKFYADLRVMRENLNIDRIKVDASLRETKLDGFEEHVFDISEKWFGEGRGDVDGEIFDIVLRNGVYGSMENFVANQIEEDGLFGFIFLPYNKMKIRFPFLKYLPFLLPFCWIVRLVSFPFSKRKLKKAWLAIKNTFNKDKS